MLVITYFKNVHDDFLLVRREFKLATQKAHKESINVHSKEEIDLERWRGGVVKFKAL